MGCTLLYPTSNKGSKCLLSLRTVITQLTWKIFSFVRFLFYLSLFAEGIPSPQGHFDNISNSCKNVSFLYVWMISNLIYYHIYTVWIKLCFIKEVWHNIFQVKQLFSLWIQLCNKQTNKQTKSSIGKFADYKCSCILLEKGGGQGLCNLVWISSHSTQLASNSALIAHDWAFLRSD